MQHSKKHALYLLAVLLFSAGWAAPLRAVDPIGQYTLRFSGKNKANDSAVSLKQVTLSNLTQGCDTTFTSGTFLLKVLPQSTGLADVELAQSVQVHLVSENPFTTAAEVEVTLPSYELLHLTLFSVDGKIQQRYAGRFESGTHRFIVEPAHAGLSFLSISNGKIQQVLKLVKTGDGNNTAQISYAWWGQAEQPGNLSLTGQTNMLRAATAQPFVYCEGDQLQMIGYADGYANSSLYDVPVKDGDYTFLFDMPYYRLRGHQIIPSKPSFVDVLFSIEDLDYNGVDNLSNEDFIIKENGASVGGTSESFAYIRKMNTVPYKIQTVLVLDNSRSLSVEDLNKMKAAAIKLINSKEDNQEIAVYSFSEEVTLVQDFTGDRELLVQAVESIPRGGNSTNLYGAYVAGVQRFTNIFTTERINQGFMVVFTDGDDTQASYTLSQAIGARGGKRVYMVGLGKEIEPATLEELANPGIFSVSNTDELEQVFLNIQQDMVRYANSFYWLNYMSPKRNTASVSLQVEVKNNSNTAGDFYYQGNFNASGFEAATGGVYIDPYIKGNGKEGYAPTYTLTNESVKRDTLSAVTYWAENMPSYVWTSSDESIAQIKAIPRSFNKAELIYPTGNNPGGTVTITVKDEANVDDFGKNYERSMQARALTAPTVTTGEVTDITGNSAKCTVTVTNDGGATVTEQGICWSTTNNPTTADSRRTGSGNLTITGLQPETTYYVRAYAINKMDTAYGEVFSFKTIFGVGSLYQGGIVFYVDATGEHGLIAAPEDQSTGIRWDNGSSVATEATGTAIGTGQSNTAKIIQAQGEGNYAAKLCDDLVLNGYDDWFLPSKDELNELYKNKTMIGGFTDRYWSSSEGNSNTAWCQNFYTGARDYSDDKGYPYGVRAVRAF